MNNAQFKAIPTKEGLVVPLNKHQLIFLKSGGIGELTLISGQQKTKMMFMRDTTFKREQKRLKALEETAEKMESEAADLGKDL